MKRKKVLIFSTAYLPLIGGAEVAVRELTDRLENYDFDMITAKIKPMPSFERVGRVNVYRIGFGHPIDKFLLPFLGVWYFNILRKENEYSLLWSIMASQAGVLASFAKKIEKDIPLILTLQEGDEEEHLKRYVGGFNFLYKILIQPWHLMPFKMADTLTVLSNYLKERAKNNGFLKKIYLVPNGVDIARFKKDYLDSEKASLKRMIGKKEGDILIISTSRLVLKNGIQYLIEALEFLPENYKLLLIGDGDLGPSLEKLTAQKELSKRVIFFGEVNNNELPLYLQISDIFARPSLSEGFGISFIEAMVSGLPVVATPVGGIPDFLKNKKTGWFCKPKDPKNLARVIKSIYSPKNEALRKEVVANAKEFVRRYDWKKVSDQMNSVLERAEKIK